MTSKCLANGWPRFGTSGVEAAFTAAFGPGSRYIDEVTSVFAEIGAALGYVTVGPRIPDDERLAFAQHVCAEFEDVDVRVDEVRHKLPPASLEVGQVLCFAPVSADGRWLCLDFAADRHQQYEPGEGPRVQEGPVLLRNLRLPVPDFTESLVLTLYGRHLYWGPGTWIHQPPRKDATEESNAIAAQLRRIEEDDPSLRRRHT